MRTHFDVLGIDKKFQLDPAELERRYLDLSKYLHPDRHATAPAAERLIAVQKTTELNDAFKTLKDDLKRAEYMLALEGIELTDDKPISNDRPTRPMMASPTLLMEVMELREALQEAQEKKDEPKIAALWEQVSSLRNHSFEVVRKGFALYDDGQRHKLQDIAQALMSMRYYTRFIEEVEAYRDGDEG